MAQDSYDVLIVGGGPAGVSTAKAAALNGAATLLIEKHPAISAWKPCGEATSKATLETAGVKPRPGLILREAYAQVYAPNMKFITINEIGYCINKALLIQDISVAAAEAGAHIHVREEFQGMVRKDGHMRVKTERGEYDAKVVVGADGYNSAVARAVGLKEKSEPIPTVQYIMAGVKLEYPDAVRFYLGQEIAPGGYAWIFPKSDKIAEVGVGVRGGVAKAYADKFVKMFDKELGSAQIIDYRGAPVPIGGVISNLAVDNVILTGDAAGTVVPFTGAGIHSSIAAGLVVGKLAAQAARDGDVSGQRLSRDFFAQYEEPWGRRIRSSLKAMRVFEKLGDDDLNTLESLVTPEDILDLANGFDLARVAKKLLGHPILAIKMARSLL
jgi:digeranylgeranylglycerophospholipid reductase